MIFSDAEKAVIFDKISKEYFEKNFGSMSKSDLETLLFSEYIEHCIRHGKAYDDYTLSKQLGITQQRIRSLKERKELKYPYEGFEWETAFAKAVENAKYDKSDHYIKMIIEDVNVMNEIRHYIEQNGWYDECSLNKKLLKIPLDCFVEICLKDLPDNIVFSDEAKENIKKLKCSENAVIEFIDEFSKDGLKAFLKSSSRNVILKILNLLPIGGIGGTAIKAIADIIGSQ